MEKRILIVFVIFLLIIMSGCVTDSRKIIYGPNTPIEVQEGVTIEILDSYTEDNYAYVQINIEPHTFLLSELNEIYIKKTEANALKIQCNKNATIDINEKDVFNEENYEDIWLVFEDDTISKSTKLQSYCAYFISKEGFVAELLIAY